MKLYYRKDPDLHIDLSVEEIKKMNLILTKKAIIKLFNIKKRYKKKKKTNIQLN